MNYLSAEYFKNENRLHNGQELSYDYYKKLYSNKIEMNLILPLLETTLRDLHLAKTNERNLKNLRQNATTAFNNLEKLLKK